MLFDSCMGDRILIFATNSNDAIQRHVPNMSRGIFFRYIFFTLELINKLYLVFMICSSIKTRIHIIGFFKKSLLELLLLEICQHLCFLIFMLLLLTHFLEYYQTLAKVAAFTTFQQIDRQKFRTWVYKNGAITTQSLLYTCWSLLKKDFLKMVQKS